MRPLFVRVFLSFLFAMAAATIAFALVMGAMRRDSLQASWSKITSGALTAIAQTAADYYTAGSPTLASNYVVSAGRIMQLDLTLFTADGKPVAGQPAPPEFELALARGGLNNDSKETVLIPARLTGVFVVTSGDSHARFALAAHVRGTLAGNLVVPVLRLLIAVLVVGLVTWLLARSITDPILRLRRATGSLASGDLSARVAKTAPLSRRKDEIGALGRDFDRMAERVEAAMLAQNRLLGDISHELRSPLTRLNVSVTIARQRDGSDTALLNRVEREAGRMNDLIEGLLTISRLDSPDKSVTPALTAIDLVRLVRKVSQDADYEAAANGSLCVADLPDSLTSIQGELELLHRAVENVTRNAVRYTNHGTTVTTVLRESSDRKHAILTVRDHGPGVPEELLAHLFHPFYRVAEARDRATGGTGLGLAIADRAVRFHGGEIRAENADGGGLLVTITLPLTP